VLSLLEPEKSRRQIRGPPGGEFVGAGRDLPILIKRAHRDHPKEMPFVARVRNPRKIWVYLGRPDGWTCPFDYERVLTSIGFVWVPVARDRRHMGISGTPCTKVTVQPEA
jgi:hypothetical protein